VRKWITFGGGQSALPDRSTMKVVEELPAPTTIETTAPTTKEVERPSLKDELDDEIGF